MIRCIIIDDEKPAIAVLKSLISKLPELQLVGSANKPHVGLNMIKEEKPEVVFLDIQMGPINGLELAKAIGNITKIVFCTAHVEYAVQSYEVSAIDYLLKPIELPRFKIAVQKVSDSIFGRITPIEAIKDDYILVKHGDRGKFKKIDIDDIVCINGSNNYVTFVCTNHDTMAYHSLKELEERLPVSGFMRVHKSHIASIKHIVAIENNEIVLRKASMRIPIGANYKEGFLERIKDKLI